MFASGCTKTSKIVESNETDKLPTAVEKKQKKPEKYIPNRYIDYSKMTLDDDNFNDIPDFADYEATNSFPVTVLELDKRADSTQSYFTFIYEASLPSEVKIINDGDKKIYLPGEGVIRLWIVDGNQDRDSRDIDKGGHFIYPGKKYPIKYFPIDENDNYFFYAEMMKKATTGIHIEWSSDLDENIDPPAVFVTRQLKTSEEIITKEDVLGHKLKFAIKESNMVLAKKIFINGGTNPNYRVDREPLLLYATRNNDIKMVKLLLKFGAKINIVDKDGHTPLYVAVENGNTNLALLYLSKNIDFSRRYKTNNDAIIAAVKNDNSELAKKILTKGANLANAKDMHGYHAVKEFLLRRQYKELDSLFALGVNPDDSPYYESLLYTTVRNKNAEQTELLLKNGLNPNKSSGNKPSTILDTAIRYKDEKTAKLLINYGANPNYVDRYGESLLHMAVRSNNITITSLLLGAGAKTEIKDDRGYTPLLWEIYKFERHRNQIGKTDLSIVKLLLKYNANINTKNKEGLAPLIIAQQPHNAKLLNLLIDAGADPFLKLVGVNSPISIAVKEGRIQQIITFLESDEADKIQALDRNLLITTIGKSLNSHYYSDKDEELVYPMQLLLSKNIDPYEKNSIGRNMVDYAIEAEKYHITVLMDYKKLYKDKYPLLLRNNLYKKLIIAVANSNISEARIYIRKGALNIVSKHEHTKDNFYPNRLLFIAVRKSNAEMVNLLLQSGLSPEAVDRETGLTLTEFVRHNVSEDVAEAVFHASADVSYVKANSASSPFSKVNKVTSTFNNESIELAWYIASKYSPTMQELSAAYRSTQFINYVIKTYSDANQESEFHQPLIAVSAYGYVTLIRDVLNRRADINHIDPHSGQTALITAVLFGKKENAKFLLKSGANPSIKSLEGLTAADYAYKEKRMEILKLVDTKGKYTVKSSSISTNNNLGTAPD